MKKLRTTPRRKAVKGGSSKQHAPWSGKSETYIDEKQQAALQRVGELREIATESGDKNDKAAALNAFCEYIRQYNPIDDAVKNLPSYPPGVYLIDGRRVLVMGVETTPT